MVLFVFFCCVFWGLLAFLFGCFFSLDGRAVRPRVLSIKKGFIRGASFLLFLRKIYVKTLTKLTTGKGAPLLNQRGENSLMQTAGHARQVRKENLPSPLPQGVEVARAISSSFRLQREEKLEHTVRPVREYCKQIVGNRQKERKKGNSRLDY